MSTPTRCPASPLGQSSMATPTTLPGSGMKPADSDAPYGDPRQGPRIDPDAETRDACLPIHERNDPTQPRQRSAERPVDERVSRRQCRRRTEHRFRARDGPAGRRRADCPFLCVAVSAVRSSLRWRVVNSYRALGRSGGPRAAVPGTARVPVMMAGGGLRRGALAWWCGSVL